MAGMVDEVNNESLSDSSDDDPHCIVIDNGSRTLKAGFAGDDSPRVVFPTVEGTPRIHSFITDSSHKSHYLGDETLHPAVRDTLSLSQPMVHGTVTDWDAMERLWGHMYYRELRVVPEDFMVLMTEAALTPAAQREKITQVFFEHFHVPGFYLAPTGMLSVYASGRGSAIVCESGDGVTQIMPIYEGHLIRQAVVRADFAGRDLTYYMAQLLAESGYSLTTPAELDFAREIKERNCYVSQDFDEDCRNWKTQKSHTLPNGSVITLGKEQFQCPEAIFNPKMAGCPLAGFHQLIHDSLMSCDVDLRRDLMGNIVLSGANTMYMGFRERMLKELSNLCPPRRNVKVIAPPERRSSAWIGGSIVASLSTFYANNSMITRQEYDEYGPCIIHRKCI